MPSRNFHAHNAIGRYRQAADKRPTAPDLRHMIASVEENAEPGTLCTLASMCIDLAFADPNSRGEALSMAQEALNDAVSTITWYSTHHPSERTIRRTSGHAVSAQLLLAELHNWQLAAEGRPVDNGYESLLGHMVIASLHTGSEPARAKLAEAVPLLLGLRQKTRTEGERGWHGRLSLCREDWRGSHGSAPGQNKSWDVGASTSEAPASFLDPEVRIQVKLGKVYNPGKYIKAGVVPMSATVYGFADPALVTISCAQEAEGFSLPGLLTSNELDDMTSRIAAAPGMNSRLAA